VVVASRWCSALISVRSCTLASRLKRLVEQEGLRPRRMARPMATLALAAGELAGRRSSARPGREGRRFADLARDLGAAGLAQLQENARFARTLMWTA
jgi:hypothetical protein